MRKTLRNRVKNKKRRIAYMLVAAVLLSSSLGVSYAKTDEICQQAETESEKQTESQKESESQKETESEKQSESQKETESEKQTESQKETESEKQSESQKETESEKQSESQKETESEKQSESQKESESEKRDRNESRRGESSGGAKYGDFFCEKLSSDKRCQSRFQQYLECDRTAKKRIICSMVLYSNLLSECVCLL